MVERIWNFLKSTKWASRIMFFLWIFLSLISNFAEESKLQSTLKFAAILLPPIVIIEMLRIFRSNKEGVSPSDNTFFGIIKNMRTESFILIYFWILTIIFMSTYMRKDIFEVGGVGFSIFCYVCISIFFLMPAFIMEYIRNPYKKKNERKEEDKYISGCRIVSLICLILFLIGIIVCLQNLVGVNATGNQASESLSATIAFGISTIILFLISLNAPKTKTEAAERKAAKQALKEEKRRQAEHNRKMRAYKGIYLSETQIRKLEQCIELPVLFNTPIFLNQGEVAVYYCEAIRQETKNRIVGRTSSYGGGTIRIAKGFSIHTGGSSSQPIYGDISMHYSGQMVLTNQRLIFLSDQKGFEVSYKAITAATAYSDGLTIQSRSHTYALLLPKADLAIRAFNAVRSGSIPIRKYSDDLDELRERTDDEDSMLDNIYINDELFENAVDLILKHGKVSASILQRYLKIGYSRAARLIEEMEVHGIVDEWNDSGPQKILITDNEWEKMRKRIVLGEKDEIRENSENETEHRKNIFYVDNMDGHEFEYFCADLLRKSGYIDVSVTPGSGDQGGDVVAVRADGTRYLIQCKRHTQPVNNKAIQEAYTAKTIYQCHVAVVMTTSTFTHGAKEAAKATGVLLWDRTVVQEMMNTVNI